MSGFILQRVRCRVDGSVVLRKEKESVVNGTEMSSKDMEAKPFETESEWTLG